MTAARRPRKPHVRLASLLALSLGLAVAALSGQLRATTTERVVVDRHTGLALYGIDPVTYFTDGKPVRGREEFE